jgi:hypothetical protein
MNHRQGSTINALHAIESFLDANELFAPLKDSTARKNIEAAVTSLETFGSDQTGSKTAKKQETAAQRDLRLALQRLHMRAIAHAAKKARLTGDDLTALSMPKGKPSVQVLLNAADGMAQAGTKNAAALMAAGLPADFVAQLNAAAAALRGAVINRDAQSTKVIAASAGLKSAEAAARTAVHVLDTQVKKLIGKDKSLLAGWHAAKRVASKPGLPRGAVAGAAAADATTQSTTHPATTPAAPATHAA